MASVLALAAEYGASRQATLHHYAQHARRRRSRCWSWGASRSATAASPSGAPCRRPASAGASARIGADLAPGRPLRELVEAARRFDAPAADLRLADGSGTPRRWTVEAHYNRRAFLVLVSAAGHGLRRAAG